MAIAALGVGGCGQLDQEKKDAAIAEFKDAVSEMQGTDGGSAVSKDTVRGWPEKFCSLDVGMTREEVRAVMGEPTSVYQDSESPG